MGKVGASKGSQRERGWRETAREAEGLGGKDRAGKGGRLENQKEKGGRRRRMRWQITKGESGKLEDSQGPARKRNRKPRKLWGKSVWRKAGEKITKLGVPPPSTPSPCPRTWGHPFLRWRLTLPPALPRQPLPLLKRIPSPVGEGSFSDQVGHLGSSCILTRPVHPL